MHRDLDRSRRGRDRHAVKVPERVVKLFYLVVDTAVSPAPDGGDSGVEDKEGGFRVAEDSRGMVVV